MATVLSESATTTAELASKVKTELSRLGAQEDRFLGLVCDPKWPQDKIATRLRKIRDERARLARQLDETAAPALDSAAETIGYLLDLLTEPRELYRQAGQRARQSLNRAFYDRIYLDADDDGPYAAEDALADLVTPLVQTARNPSLLDPGSSKRTMVELRGFEPQNARDLQKRRHSGVNGGRPGRTSVGGCWPLTALFDLCCTGFIPDDLAIDASRAVGIPR